MRGAGPGEDAPSSLVSPLPPLFPPHRPVLLRQERDQLAASAEGATRVRLKTQELQGKQVQLDCLRGSARTRLNGLLGASVGAGECCADFLARLGSAALRLHVTLQAQLLQRPPALRRPPVAPPVLAPPVVLQSCRPRSSLRRAWRRRCSSAAPTWRGYGGRWRS